MFNPLTPVKINKSLDDKNTLLLQIAMRKTKDNEINKIKSINETKNKDEKLNNKLLTKTLIKNIGKQL
jgi:hypothetical protein